MPGSKTGGKTGAETGSKTRGETGSETGSKTSHLVKLSLPDISVISEQLESSFEIF